MCLAQRCLGPAQNIRIPLSLPHTTSTTYSESWSYPSLFNNFLTTWTGSESCRRRTETAHSRPTLICRITMILCRCVIQLSLKVVLPKICAQPAHRLSSYNSQSMGPAYTDSIPMTSPRTYSNAPLHADSRTNLSAYPDSHDTGAAALGAGAAGGAAAYGTRQGQNAYNTNSGPAAQSSDWMEKGGQSGGSGKRKWIVSSQCKGTTQRTHRNRSLVVSSAFLPS